MWNVKSGCGLETADYKCVDVRRGFDMMASWGNDILDSESSMLLPIVVRPMEQILIVDDNRSDRKLLRDALESEGYGVEEAADGTEGLRTLFARRPGAMRSGRAFSGTSSSKSYVFPLTA